MPSHYINIFLTLCLAITIVNAQTRPPHQNLTATARWVVRNTEWGVLSTISTQSAITGYPFGNAISFADGNWTSGTGHLWFYVSDSDVSMQDIAANAQCSFAVSEREIVGGCPGIDAEDPRCARVILSGRWRNTTAQENAVARNALFSKHPAMMTWPRDHHFHTCTIDLQSIWILD